jgi:hypothetical protein
VQHCSLPSRDQLQEAVAVNAAPSGPRGRPSRSGSATASSASRRVSGSPFGGKLASALTSLPFPVPSLCAYRFVTVFNAGNRRRLADPPVCAS